MDLMTLTVAWFVFFLGTCVGSFLNVVVYRMPRGMSIVSPPSACPNCHHRLAFYDNIPVVGWIWLKGKCRYCRCPISIRYPLVELVTGLLFLFHFLMLFVYGWGPYEVHQISDMMGITRTQLNTPDLSRDWPILVLHLWLIGALLSASLIDLEHYIIPLSICWWTAGLGAIFHAFFIPEGHLGNLHQPPPIDAAALGGGLGLLLSLFLLKRGIIQQSFAEDQPLLEKDRELLPENQRPEAWPAWRIRREIRLEMLFLIPPCLLAGTAVLLVQAIPELGQLWARFSSQSMVSGFLGSLWGALVGGMIVWFFRIAGSYGFGREAMGLGDVHLMFGVGAVIGAGATTVAFFLAPAAGLLIALVQWLNRGRREIPYGPYLSLATYVVLLFYTPIALYLAPGMQGLLWAVEELISTGASGR